MRFTVKLDLGVRGHLSVGVVVGWNLPGKWFRWDVYRVVGLRVRELRVLKCVSMRIERISRSKAALIGK